MSPEDRTTKTCGRFNESVGSWSGHFCRLEYELHWGNLPNDYILIAGFELANFIIKEKVLRMDPRSDRCVSWYFIGKQFFQFANSWYEVPRRSGRSFLRVGCGLEIDVCRIVCFRCGCSHSAHRGRTTKFCVISAGECESRWSRVRVRVRIN